MALRQILLPWDSQPQEAVQVSDAYRDACLSLSTGPTTYDVVSGSFQGTINGITAATTPAGVGIKLASTGAVLDPAVPESNAYCIFALIVPAAVNITAWVYDRIISSNIFVRCAVVNAGLEMEVVNTAGVSTKISLGSVLAVGEPIAVWFWCDGVNAGVHTNKGSSQGAVTGTPRTLSANAVYSRWFQRAFAPNGNNTSNGTGNFSGTIVARGVFRYLDAAARQSVVDSPWALFEPQRIWVPVSAGAGGTSYDVTIAESASAGDNTVAAQLAAAAISEAASGADAVSSLAVLSAALSEAGSSVDTVTAGAATYAVSLAETSAADDTAAAILQAAASIAEAGSAGDALSSAQVAVVSLSEAADADDAANWGGAIYAVSLTEAASAADAVSRVLQAAAEVAEGTSASDTVAAVLSLTGAAVEPADAVDAIEVALQLVAGLAEAGMADDQTSSTAAVVHTVLLLESGVAVDLVWAHPLVVIVPRQRTLFIAAEDRALRIAAEDRTLRIRLP